MINIMKTNKSVGKSVVELVKTCDYICSENITYKSPANYDIPNYMYIRAIGDITLRDDKPIEKLSPKVYHAKQGYRPVKKIRTARTYKPSKSLGSRELKSIVPEELIPFLTNGDKVEFPLWENTRQLVKSDGSKLIVGFNDLNPDEGSISYVIRHIDEQLKLCSDSDYVTPMNLLELRNKVLNVAGIARKCFEVIESDRVHPTTGKVIVGKIIGSHAKEEAYLAGLSLVRDDHKPIGHDEVQLVNEKRVADGKKPLPAYSMVFRKVFAALRKYDAAVQGEKADKILIISGNASLPDGESLTDLFSTLEHKVISSEPVKRKGLPKSYSFYDPKDQKFIKALCDGESLFDALTTAGYSHHATTLSRLFKRLHLPFKPGDIGICSMAFGTNGTTPLVTKSQLPNGIEVILPASHPTGGRGGKLVRIIKRHRRTKAEIERREKLRKNRLARFTAKLGFNPVHNVQRAKDQGLIT